MDNDVEGDDDVASSLEKTKFQEKQWVGVSYPGKNKNSSLNFIGEIQAVLPRVKLLNIMFVKRQSVSNDLKFPEDEDIDPRVPFDYY